MKGSLRASLWMLTASLLFAAMGACIKFGSTSFGAIEFVFWRNLVSAIAIGAYAAAIGERVTTPLWRIHLTRSLSGFIAQVLYFFAIVSLPIATAFTLNYTSPLWLAALVALVTRERLRPGIWGALALGMVGVALLLKPSLAHAPWIGALYGLTGAAISALAYLNVRRLGEAREPEWRTVFWFSVVCAVGSAPFALSGAHTPLSWSGRELTLMLGVSVFGISAQLAMTRAYCYGKTLLSAALSYSTVVFATLIGVFAFGDSLDPLSLAGIAVVITSGIFAGHLSRRPAR